MGLFVGDSEPSKIFVGDTPISKVFLGDVQVRPSGGGGWQPGADTVAYYPLTSSTTTIDSQGNYNLSNSGNVTFGTHNSVSCAYFNGTSTSRLYNSSISYNSYPTYTVNCRFFLDYSGSRYQTIYTIGNTYATGLLGVWYNYDVNGGSIALGAYSGGYETVTQISISTNTRHNLVVVVNGSSSKQYLDGVQIATYTNSLSNTQTGLNLGCPSHNSNDTLGGGISEFILENKVWTAQEIADYYNQTKDNYQGETVWTFDFQNDGDLGWSGYSIGYGTPDYVTGEGWAIGSSNSGEYQGGITIPNSVFVGALKSIKFWWSKPTTSSTYTGGSACGICSQNQSTAIDFSRTGSSGDIITIYPGGIRTNTSNITGEITTEYIMEDNGDLVVDINGTQYNVGQYASVYQGLWSNQALYILQGRWKSAVSYIRKIEITTA